jgi:NADPH:quinone reductase-like Zn-dependent oxidoreductase
MGKETFVTGIALWAGGDAALTRAFAGIRAGLFGKTLRPIVGTELPLHQAGKAQELVMQDGNAAGKIVLIT